LEALLCSKEVVTLRSSLASSTFFCSTAERSFFTWVLTMLFIILFLSLRFLFCLIRFRAEG